MKQRSEDFIDTSSNEGQNIATGAITGGTIGAFCGGPIGAAIGAAIGGFFGVGTGPRKPQITCPYCGATYEYGGNDLESLQGQSFKCSHCGGVMRL